jgi:periplasmic protein TonB
MKIPFIDDRGELLRWALSGAIVVFLHGAVTAAMINWSDDDASEPTAAMVVDLAPFPLAPPESVTDLPPGPAQVEAEASPQTPVTEVKEQVEERPETAQSQELQPELAPAVNPEVALDTSPPKPEQKIELQQENQLPAPETTAPPEMPAVETAEVAAAQVQGPPTVDRSNVDPKYWASISAQIERNKRFPPDGKNDRGVAQIAFSIDRKGRVVSSRIVTTSGSPALDREALEIIKRSQPFPPPPAAVQGTEVSLTVPVRFNLR